MSERPSLNQIKDGKTLREYYFLKEEPVGFCRENGLPTTGGKLELTERIAVFLDSGEIKQAPSAALGFIRAEIEKPQDFFRGLFGNFAFFEYFSPYQQRFLAFFTQFSRLSAKKPPFSGGFFAENSGYFSSLLSFSEISARSPESLSRLLKTFEG